MSRYTPVSIDSPPDRDLDLWQDVSPGGAEPHEGPLRGAPGSAPIGTTLATLLEAKDGKMLAARVMQKDVISVSPELSLRDFEELLVGEDISGAAVVGTEGQVVGVASKTDIVRALGDEKPLLAAELDESMTVGDIMTREVFTIRPDAEVSEVAQQMIDGRIHRIFVCDGNELLGIITPFDLLKLLV